MLQTGARNRELAELLLEKLQGKTLENPGKTLGKTLDIHFLDKTLGKPWRKSWKKSWTPISYVRNDPVNLVDPDGMF